MTNVAGAGAWVAMNLLFLWFKYGGLKERIVQEIKSNLTTDLPLVGISEQLEDKNLLELWETFCVIQTHVYPEVDANVELQT